MDDYIFAAFFFFFFNNHQSDLLSPLIWLVPHETAAVSARSVYTIHNNAPCIIYITHSGFQARSRDLRGGRWSWTLKFAQKRVSGASSHFVNVMSGMPQGSVLGPCLFLAYINDMPEKLSAFAWLFADDTAVYKMISNGHDQAQLQEDLQRLADWEESWDIEFHPAKCQTRSITRSRKPLQPSYVLHGHTLENVSSAKYLGVTNNTVSWDDHICNTCSKANRALASVDAT